MDSVILSYKSSIKELNSLAIIMETYPLYSNLSPKYVDYCRKIELLIESIKPQLCNDLDIQWFNQQLNRYNYLKHDNGKG